MSKKPKIKRSEYVIPAGLIFERYIMTPAMDSLYMSSAAGVEQALDNVKNDLKSLTKMALSVSKSDTAGRNAISAATGVAMNYYYMLKFIELTNKGARKRYEATKKAMEKIAREGFPEDIGPIPNHLKDGLVG